MAPLTLIQVRLIAYGDKAPYPSPVKGEGVRGDCKVDVYVNANYGAVHNFSRGALSP